MERCIFCGSTRKSAPNLRFFGIPREPGLKRIQWFYVLGDKDIGPKDRVCANHFRQGKPVNDPSHEDFLPHLNLCEEQTEENRLEYLESLDNAKNIEPRKKKRRINKPTILQKRKNNDMTFQNDKRITATMSDCKQPTIIPIPTSIIEAITLEPGQEVIIKQYKIVKRRKIV